jgi:hypothetical protein
LITSKTQHKTSSCLRLNQIIGEAYGTLIGLSLADLAPYKRFYACNVVLEIGKKHKFESSLRGQSWSNGIDKRLLVRSLEFHNNAGDYVFVAQIIFWLLIRKKKSHMAKRSSY